MIRELDSEDALTEAVGDEQVLVDFHAPWCGPCRQMEPVVEEFSEEAGVPVVKVDVDENPNTAEKFGIRSVPTFLAFDGGEQTGETVGTSSQSELENLFA